MESNIYLTGQELIQGLGYWGGGGGGGREDIWEGKSVCKKFKADPSK